MLGNKTRFDLDYSYSPPPPKRPPPPIWLPPPPPLSSDEDDDEGEFEYPEEEGSNFERNNPFNHSKPLPPDPRRIGRSVFTPAEINSLETPRSNGIGQRSQQKWKSIPRKLFSLLLISFPALCFTISSHLIVLPDSDWKFLGACFTAIQCVFWSSLTFLVIDVLRNGCVKTFCNVSILWAFFHSFLSAISVLALLTSMQRLNVSVAISLSFVTNIFVVLLSHIHREKRFSVETIVCAVIGYLGVVLVGFPAMATLKGREAINLTVGVIASLISSFLGVPGSFVLAKIRQVGVIPDSILTTLTTLLGSGIALLVAFGAKTNEFRQGPHIEWDWSTISWAAGIALFTILGTVGALGQSRVGGNKMFYVGILRMRVLMLLFSCLWELIQKGVWQDGLPEIYGVVGSFLVVVAFILSVGFEAWALQVPDFARKSGFPFEFLPWLFTRKVYEERVQNNKPDKSGFYV